MLPLLAACCVLIVCCSPVRLGRSGVEEFLPLGPMNELEQRNYDTMLPELAGSIQKGVEFVQKRQQQQARQ
jgi:malate/lactate dehydrogenase